LAPGGGKRLGNRPKEEYTNKKKEEIGQGGGQTALRAKKKKTPGGNLCATPYTSKKGKNPARGRGKGLITGLAVVLPQTTDLLWEFSKANCRRAQKKK